MEDRGYPETYHRWEWFRRDQWWPSFRERMLSLRGRDCGALGIALGGLQGKRVLDATCGLGRRTLVLRALGAEVVGSDICAYAVERARELAASEGEEIPFIVSEWQSLPEHLPSGFDGALVDAFMDCCETYEELAAAFAGIAAVLKPGGVFLHVTPAPDERAPDTIAFAWENGGPQFSLAWQHREEACECTCLHARSRGEDWIDGSHLYVIREQGADARLEVATIRQWFRWEWRHLESAARTAGFSSIEYHAFEGCGWEGGPLPRAVARR